MARRLCRDPGPRGAGCLVRKCVVAPTPGWSGDSLVDVAGAHSADNRVVLGVVPGPQMPRGLLSPQWSLQGRQQRPLGPGVCAHSAAGTAGRVCTAAGSSRKDAQSRWPRGGGWGTKVHSRSGNYRGHAGGCRGPGRQCALPRPHGLPLGTRTTVEPVVKGVRLAGAGAEAGAERAHGGGHQPPALGGGRAPSVSHGACDGVW